MKKINLLLSIFVLSTSLFGCSVLEPSKDAIEDDEVVIEKELEEKETTDIFSNRDLNEDTYYTDANEYVEINLSTLSATNDLVLIEDNVIYITSKGTYVFTGKSNNVKIQIDTSKKVQLILNNVEMTSDSEALIHMIESDKTFVRVDGVNTLTTLMKEEVDGVDGAIFAKDNISFNGEGVLNINSYLNGIVAKDDLTITNGTYNILSTANAIEVNEELAITNATFNITTNGGQENAPYQEAEEENFSPGMRPWSLSTEESWSCKAFKCDEFIYIKDGTFNIDSYDDAFHCDEVIIIDGGEFNIKTGDDAIHSNLYLEINGGNIDIDYCYEGLEAQRIMINDGAININSYDDGINAAKNDENGDENGVYICVNGGTIIITIIEISKSPEADGFDSNGDILITGGYILISGTTNTKDTPLDYDGDAQITGGTFLTGGSYSMTDQNFGTSSTQGAIYVNLGSSASTDVVLKDSNGNIVVEYSLVNEFQIIHISTEDIKLNEVYTLVVANKSYTINMTSNIVNLTFK